MPVPRDRYRALARSAGLRARLRRPLVAIDAAFIVLAGLIALAGAPLVGGAIGDGAAGLAGSVAGVLPGLQGTQAIELPSGGASVTADPIVQGLPDYAREPQVTLAGYIPAFALATGRVLDVALNGANVATLTPDSAGAFSTPLTLQNGPNLISLTYRTATDVVSKGSYTVVLKREPPTLGLLKPQTGDTVDGPNVSVTGKAEQGASVTVNDRRIVPAQDGSFTDTFQAADGPLTITVVATDRAGNATTVKSVVTVKTPTTAAPLALTVTLDRTRVTPGAQVLAEIRATANGLPRSGETVTLSVGVITIGSAKTDTSGIARIGFAAPPNEGDAAVVVLANGASARATLTVAK